MTLDARSIALAATVFGAILAASACNAEEDAGRTAGTGAGSNGTEGGAGIACEGPAQCGTEYQNAFVGFMPCRDGYCAPCESDAECDGSYCQDGRCVDCLTDAHCPAEKPWCYFVSEGTRRICFECTIDHECAKGYCFGNAMFPGGGKCLAGDCATSPSGYYCYACLTARMASSGTCPQCAEAASAYAECASTPCAPDCCSTEYATALSCLKSCLGDECD